MSDADVGLGPVDYVLVAFPADQAHFPGRMASQLVELRGGLGDRRRRGPGLFR